jgi:Rrf2 family nitric oxide-sensitive transcriptional repressor
LRILLEAAGNRDIRLSIADVARSHGISKNHVMKVVNQLARGGLLETTRGRGGGFALAREPADIRLGDVVRLTEPDLQPADCGQCVLRIGCGLTPLLGAAMRAFLGELDRRTLADALRGSNWPRPRPRPHPDPDSAKAIA